MSKRKGDYITLDDLINEVGKDATKVHYVEYSCDVELDFDFDNVVEKSKENHFIMYNIVMHELVFRHINKDIKKGIDVKEFNFEYSEDEINNLEKTS